MAATDRPGWLRPKTGKQVYGQRHLAILAKKLDELPHGFPATRNGVELQILRKIFSPDEAEMTLNMRPVENPTDSIM
ncbi:MAG: hypothetical protein H8E10_21705 [Desulfobacterales bacterium]|nr:hypothetical protein [Desulfobacterales bacterium]MBL7204377.1 hypothetical protein [Desulfobacteraceae bacterium]